ncbi:hypothetical protein ACIGCM_03690 [Pseudomonas sp. NPDC078700]|uniref:hypothetical protein n=1 Tax=Pseudomonas sp. NPDC078700 TaxID=3364424 RepID=UPI0037C8D886
MRKLDRCEVCVGKGVIKGIFHRMACAGCNGSGLVDPSTRLALDYPELVEQLRVRLDHATKGLERLKRGIRPVTGVEADYQGKNNKRHPGGGNYTGD